MYLLLFIIYILDCIVDHKLKKVGEEWGKKPGDGNIYYMFRPPWIKSRGVEAYYALHPEIKKNMNKNNVNKIS